MPNFLQWLRRTPTTVTRLCIDCGADIKTHYMVQQWLCDACLETRTQEAEEHYAEEPTYDGFPECDWC